MCDILRVIDCNHHYHSSGDETLCCTDGHTYSNKCLYVQAKCDNVRLEPMHSGPCTEADKKPRGDNMTTDSPAVVPTSDNFTITPEFCADTRPCPINLNPICGNNHIFYVNLCDFNKAKCKDSSLQRIQLSDCKSTSSPPSFLYKYRNLRKRKQRKGNRE
ncbi:agrin-like [Saccostrea echinata]|uniref:agrin-like n=1 Tax=Saccostrea echinata TaxID=191078 RepID=UPI002A832AAD|nr:agrin-like [Saccostrea echinata]